MSVQIVENIPNACHNEPIRYPSMEVETCYVHVQIVENIPKSCHNEPLK